MQGIMKRAETTWERETSTQGGKWNEDVADFGVWLAQIHKEAQEHTERIRARQGIPAWLMR